MKPIPLCVLRMLRVVCGGHACEVCFDPGAGARLVRVPGAGEWSGCLVRLCVGGRERCERGEAGREGLFMSVRAVRPRWVRARAACLSERCPHIVWHRSCIIMSV